MQVSARKGHSTLNALHTSTLVQQHGTRNHVAEEEQAYEFAHSLRLNIDIEDAIFEALQTYGFETAQIVLRAHGIVRTVHTVEVNPLISE